MRASLPALSSVCLLFTCYVPAINAITLNQFQPLDGFPQACVNAYNTPLSGCTASDFVSGSCSTSCIAFLEALTQVLNSECAGTSANPNTLIGSFFKNEGTSILCPNVLSGSGGANYGTTVVSGPASVSTSSLYTWASTTIATLPILSAAPNQFTSSPSSSSTTTSAAATTTQIAVVNTTVSPNSSLLQPSPSSTDKVQSKASTTPIPNDSKTTSGAGGGDGGSPLDVGSSAAIHNARTEAWVLGLMVGSAGLALLL